MAPLDSALRKNRSAPPAVQASRLPVRVIPAPRSTFPVELSATVSASKKYVLARELLDESMRLEFNRGGSGPRRGRSGASSVNPSGRRSGARNAGEDTPRPLDRGV